MVTGAVRYRKVFVFFNEKKVDIHTYVHMYVRTNDLPQKNNWIDDCKPVCTYVYIKFLEKIIYIQCT